MGPITGKTGSLLVNSAFSSHQSVDWTPADKLLLNCYTVVNPANLSAALRRRRSAYAATLPRPVYASSCFIKGGTKRLIIVIYVERDMHRPA